MLLHAHTIDDVDDSVVEKKSQQVGMQDVLLETVLDRRALDLELRQKDEIVEVLEVMAMKLVKLDLQDHFLEVDKSIIHINKKNHGLTLWSFFVLLGIFILNYDKSAAFRKYSIFCHIVSVAILI
jgi:hypothetical protein